MIATFFKHGSNGVITAAILLLAVLFALRDLSFSVLGAAIGVVIFLGSEYSTHRFLFHARPMKNGFILKLQHLLHYDHHVDPPKLELLFLPLWFTIPVMALYFGVYFAIVRNADLALSLVFGSLLALMYYEWLHYVAHVAYIPRTALGKYMKKFHLWHHFKNEHLWFGVTNPAIDHVAGTYRNVDDVERSTTVREIYR